MSNEEVERHEVPLGVPGALATLNLSVLLQPSARLNQQLVKADPLVREVDAIYGRLGQVLHLIVVKNAAKRILA